MYNWTVFHVLSDLYESNAWAKHTHKKTQQTSIKNYSLKMPILLFLHGFGMWTYVSNRVIYADGQFIFQQGFR